MVQLKVIRLVQDKRVGMPFCQHFVPQLVTVIFLRKKLNGVPTIGNQKNSRAEAFNPR